MKANDSTDDQSLRAPATGHVSQPAENSSLAQQQTSVCHSATSLLLEQETSKNCCFAFFSRLFRCPPARNVSVREDASANASANPYASLDEDYYTRSLVRD